ncbi:zf-HC2 domain-containing protein [Actinoplanes regularis]|uniref:Putative zinc-finger domain-containing protein n=1 Tax=Actinoplanes regularis TaxID=52697 RepID=A0A238UYK4_9ACTN|nr:zf-HC2 domain-containing protein [Actinoplanes regularis]GIE84322.1 membrane protein [Actinoplanes regularis]SNR26383.1 hypothetical protein SAMN06264365_101264 [Actinoplanes regularis]
MTKEEHYDVASYALGVLGDRDAARFEDHLIDCPQCAFELESFVQVADAMADVDVEALLAAEKSEKDGVLLSKMIHEVGTDRRRANSRRLYSLAAAVVVFAMLSIGSLFAGGKWLAPEPTSPANNTALRDSSQLDPLPDSDGVPIGGTALPGKNYSGTDSRSNVSAAVGLEKKDWGTQISFAVSNIKGPKTCALTVVHTDGTSERVATWTIGDKGWGTAANPSPLMLQAVTGTAREDIAHVQVQELSTSGNGETLISIP